MKIAVTSMGRDMESPMDPRFGRSGQFLVFDPDRGTFDILDNQVNLNAAQGAGIQAAQLVANAGCGVLITGHCGPKAFNVLTAAGVKVYQAKAQTVMEALAQFKSGKLVEITTADVEGHWL